MEYVKKILGIDIGKIWNGSPAIEYLANYIEQLSKLTNIRAVVVIGSRARGNWKLSSDIDTIIIVDKAISYTELPSLGIVDPRIYTVEELFEAINSAEYELIEAFEEGKIIYDDGIWKEMQKTYEGVKERLKIRRYKKGWKIHAESKTRKKLEHH
jgi:predicted nucleotidyltransferase